jgi:selenocysteine lyase/cysteine desulfurase
MGGCGRPPAPYSCGDRTRLSPVTRMEPMERPLEPAFLRRQIVGIDSTIETPFGERLMVYCDYTASGRCLTFIEDYLQGLQRHYANTHTEDDVTGRSMTRLLHQAERIIKDAVNAGPGGCVVAVGTGATGAIDKFQQILGVALPPATRARLEASLEAFLGFERLDAFRRHHDEQQPVVFVGPFEHHSNEVTWRQGLATVVEVDLTPDGGVDLEHLAVLLQDPRFAGRPLIGSFSAASNVTGMRAPVHELARLLHRHGALACFDFAASGPYVGIDMNPPSDRERDDPSLDAIFLSPHKFLGGPGSAGILVFNERVYRRDLPPTVGGGGTVDYVGPTDQDFVTGIEEREKAGTPGVLQIFKAALAFQVKEGIGVDRIESREQELLERAFARWQSIPAMEILGHPDPRRRVGIVSFNIRTPQGRYLHPKFVTVLLNDLFGIQSRAGCSCAGPYGHRLLEIDMDHSERYREWVRKGYQGIKPGWCRVGLHYAMDDLDADYVIAAVAFVAERGHRFLPAYSFDAASGIWSHRDHAEHTVPFGLGAALDGEGLEMSGLPEEDRRILYQRYLTAAAESAEAMPPLPESAVRAEGPDFGDLRFFEV